MYNTTFRLHRSLFLFIFMLMISSLVSASNDTSIKGELRTNIQNKMKQYITNQSIDKKLYVYDSVQNKLMELDFVELHTGIVKKGNFYVSCADFIDQDNKKVDLDFMVRPSGEVLITTQAIVHSVAGNKRTYHVSDR